MAAGWDRSLAGRLQGAAPVPRESAELKRGHLQLEDGADFLVNSLQRRLVRVVMCPKQNGLDHRGWMCDERVRRTVWDEGPVIEQRVSERQTQKRYLSVRGKLHPHYVVVQRRGATWEGG
jgi:hypothetical protein